MRDNPARLVKSLSEKNGERQVYLSHADFLRLLNGLPFWCQPVTQVAYYSGMRRGEILGLKRSQIDLSARIICLGAKDTKEGNHKRVPIALELMPVLLEALKVQAIGHDTLFLRDGKPFTRGCGRRSWERAPRDAGLDKGIHFHDLQACFKTNARRSGMDEELRRAIMGHSSRQRSVSNRYGWISNEELVQAIDRVTFGHGETAVWVSL